jgi:hypothetical protein
MSGSYDRVFRMWLGVENIDHSIHSRYLANYFISLDTIFEIFAS